MLRDSTALPNAVCSGLKPKVLREMFSAFRRPTYSKKNPQKIFHKNFPHIFHANSISKKRGMLIATKDTVAFKLCSKEVDGQGHFIILM